MKPIFLPFFLLLPFFIPGQTIDSLATQNQIDSLLEISKNHYAQGDYKKALDLHLIGKQLTKDLYGEMSADFAKMCSGQGFLLHVQLKYSEAEQYYLQAKNITEKVLGKEHISYLIELGRLGLLYDDTGYYAKAEQYYLEAKSFTERNMGKEHAYHAISLSTLGTLYHTMGHFEKSEQYQLASIALKEKTWGTDSPRYSGSLFNLGILYHDMGQYEKAEEIYAEALALQEKNLGKEDRQYAATMSSMALLYNDMGDLFTAEKLYLEAIPIYEKILGKDHPSYANSLQNLGDLYLKTGNLNKAEKLYTEASATIKAALGNEHPDYALSLASQGHLYRIQKNYEKANYMLSQAITIQENSLSAFHPHYATSLHSLGLLEQEIQNFSKAESLLLKAMAIRKDSLGKHHSDYAKNLQSLAKLYFENENPSSATQFALDANHVFKKNINRGALHLSEQEMQNYLTSFKNNIDLLTSFCNYDDSPETIEAVLDNNLFYKGFLLDKNIQMQQLLKATPDSIQLQYREWKGLQRQLSMEYSKPLPEQNNLKDLLSSANTLEKYLVKYVSGFEEASSSITWQDIQNQLAPNEAILEFVHYKFQNPHPTDSIYYAALLLRKEDKSPLYVPLFQEKEISSLKATRRLYAMPPNASNASLHHLIWNPISKYLENIQTIYYAPSGLLHRINFGAIPTNETTTIAQNFELHNLGSTRYLAFPPSPSISNASDAIIFGGIQYEENPDNLTTETPETSSEELLASRNLGDSFRSFRGEDWNYLEWTAKEANAVENSLKDSGAKVTTYTGFEATEATFKKIGQETPAPRILHLATHGYFFPDVDTSAVSGFQSSKHPLIRSGLVLAGANAAWKGEAIEGQEDGILTAYEIAQMDLSNTELVVLSACDTGLGDIEGNEGVYGLQRAFKLAGVKYVLMSLWSVSDKKTYDFMTTFYQEWLAGKTIPQAYQNTQNAMRKKFALPFNPRNWAGFVLVE